MKEKKGIPWELIISTAFSGFGIAVLSWLKDMLKDFFTIDFYRSIDTMTMVNNKFVILSIINNLLNEG